MEQNCVVYDYLRKTILNFGFYILIFGFLDLRGFPNFIPKLPV
jgi:hypothetical protein